MNLKTFLNAIAIFIGLGLVAFQFNRGSQSEQVTVVPQSAEKREFERWNLKEGSIYDGDTLRARRGEEELKIRFCGIDAPEKNQEFGIESRDYLRSLIAKSDGRIHVLPIEKDRYGRTVAELWIPIKPDFEGEIHLNTAMVEAGYAYHYQQYSGSCESAENLGWAEKIARDDKLGVWNGSHQEPWEFRKANK